jgi:hypothetical protein
MLSRSFTAYDRNFGVNVGRAGTVITVLVICRHSVPASQKTQCISIAKMKLLMLFREIIDILSEHGNETHK